MAQDKNPDNTVARSVRASGDDPNPRGVYNGRETVNRRDRPDLGVVSEPARAVPVFAETDVLVVGGGPAGVTAAVAAARLGARVILAERYNHLGGLSTGGLVVWIDRMSGWGGEHLIQGMAAEMLDRLPSDAIRGPKRADWGSRDEALVSQWAPRHTAFHGTVTWAPMIDPEWLKIVALNMVEDSGVELLLHSWVTAPLVEDGKATGAILESKQGRMAVRAKVVVDTTGDGDMFAQAGEDFDGDAESDDIHHCANTASLMGGVDVPRWLQFRAQDPDGFREFMRGGRTETSHFILPMAGWRDDTVVFMGPRFSGFNVLKVDDLTALEILSRKSIVELLDYFRRRAPGFEDAWIMLTAPQLGARHSRRLAGRDVMTGTGTKSGVILPDEIGVSPSLSPNLPEVSVPYGALLPLKTDNLLVAGRHISTDSQTHTFMREIPQCWLTGHAAGAAAALSANSGVAPRDLDIGDLQSALTKQGAFVRANQTS
ncbi:MAG: FAD-dependent oxidoreductase [Rhodospirillaceae bacterium]|jgi:hypothetical protein|nr:FAD-dependent oxidoreductase [Rhodospirillaceae bacterium]MBT5664636.1 FAD-dependent oxidoreductase [Rhodospirillaceae bacterium]MBT5809616.1 FAD-dependent oxidoreductase [Rhodospirillaceae bacterium]